MMEAGRELDALVAEKVMGWTRGPLYWVDPREPDKLYGVGYTHSGGDYDFKDFSPSTDIAAAWQVWERVSKPNWAIYRSPSGDYEVMEHIKWEDWYTYAEAPTAPHAICLTALRAVGGVL